MVKEKDQKKVKNSKNIEIRKHLLRTSKQVHYSKDFEENKKPPEFYGLVSTKLSRLNKANSPSFPTQD